MNVWTLKAHPWQQFGSLLGGFFDRRIPPLTGVIWWYPMHLIFRCGFPSEGCIPLCGWFWNRISVGWSEMPLGSSCKSLMRLPNNLWRSWIDYPSPQEIFVPDTKISYFAVNSTDNTEQYIFHTMEPEGTTPNQCRFTFEKPTKKPRNSTANVNWHCHAALQGYTLVL